MRPRTVFHASVIGTILIVAATTSASARAAPAESGAGPAAPDSGAEWTDAAPSGRLPTSIAYGMDPRARAEWVNECRRRVASTSNGMGAAIVGGVIGGLAGNRIAGSSARTVGTLTGVAVGAVAGAAIDQAQSRSRAGDGCEAYYDDYYARYSQNGYGQTPYGYAPQTVMIPVTLNAAGDCPDSYETAYEDLPPRRRIIRRAVPRQVQAAPGNPGRAR